LAIVQDSGALRPFTDTTSPMARVPNDFNIQPADAKDRVAPYSHGDGCWHIRVAITDAAASELALSTKGLPAPRGGGMEARRRMARAFLPSLRTVISTGSKHSSEMAMTSPQRRRQP
jgi:hypothetical protein